MLADPVKALFAGLRSSVGRSAFAFIAVFAGAAVIYLSLGFVYLDWSDLYLWLPLTIGLLFWWASYGGWFFVGLLSFVAIFASLWAFTQERSPKLSFFLIFSATAIYYAPLCFYEQRWLRAVIIYAGCALLYWFLPLAFSRLDRNA